MRMKTKTLKKLFSSRMGKNAQLLMETFLYMGGMEYLDMLTTQTMKDALS